MVKKLSLSLMVFCIVVWVGMLVVGIQSAFSGNWTIVSWIGQTRVTFYPAFVLACVAVIGIGLTKRTSRTTDIKE